MGKKRPAAIVEPTETTSESRLDERRRALRDARDSASAAETTVTRIDTELNTTATRISSLEGELAGTRDTVARLKKSLTAAGKHQTKLRAGRDQARQKSAKAHQRADTAERKYDRAMLADMLLREKQHDLTEHGTEPSPEHLAEPSTAAASTPGLSTPGLSTLSPPLPSPAPTVDPAPTLAGQASADQDPTDNVESRSTRRASSTATARGTRRTVTGSNAGSGATV